MSTKKPCTPLPASQAAQILEHVEKLLALHEQQGNDGAADQGLPLEVAPDVGELLTQQSLDLLESFDSINEQNQNKTVELIRAVSALIEKRFEKFDERLNEVTSTLDSRLSSVASEQVSTNDPPVEPNESPPVKTAAPVNDSVSHWEKQKAEMLAKYGIDPEYRPVMEPQPHSDAQPEPVPNPLEDLEQSINSMSPDDAKAIEDLKAELTSKLRDAEIELSIDRAKIIQQKSALDKRQFELDRRESTLRKENVGQESSDGKSGILDRFKKHLPSKKNSR